MDEAVGAHAAGARAVRGPGRWRPAVLLRLGSRRRRAAAASFIGTAPATDGGGGGAVAVTFAAVALALALALSLARARAFLPLAQELPQHLRNSLCFLGLCDCVSPVGLGLALHNDLRGHGLVHRRGRAGLCVHGFDGVNGDRLVQPHHAGCRDGGVGRRRRRRDVDDGAGGAIRREMLARRYDGAVCTCDAADGRDRIPQLAPV